MKDPKLDHLMKHVNRPTTRQNTFIIVLITAIIVLLLVVR